VEAEHSAVGAVPCVLSLTSWGTMRSSYRFPHGVPQLRLDWRTVYGRMTDRRQEQGARRLARARERPQPAAGYAATTCTSSSVISPSTIRNERNWKGPASSVSAVETRT
jgi:hypothetical protein